MASGFRGMVVSSALAALFVGCGGGSKSDETPAAGGDSSGTGAAGAPASVASACSGTLSVNSSKADVTCLNGVTAWANGLYHVTFRSTEGNLTLTLPTLEAGSYTAADCAQGILARAGGDFSAQLDQPDMKLDLSYDGDDLVLQVDGQFCRQTGTVSVGGVSMPRYSCLGVLLIDGRTTVASEPSSCDCPSHPTVANSCQIGVCQGDQCGFVYCAKESAFCQAL